MKKYTLILLAGLLAGTANAQKSKSSSAPEKKDPMESSVFSSLSFRSIGPAVASGRIVDIKVNPNNPSEYYVVAASGGVWKTTNNGITYEPVFQNEGSYSVGCVTIDPSNTNTVWVGSGENNNQRSVAYGDGVYKSEDGGKSWKNMGLKSSEHIGMITVDPNNSDVVYVAAYGPLWTSGGERGIYKTTDGGKTWKAVLQVDENTGFNEIHMDPRNSNVLYACAHQRQRKLYMYVSGGPGSAIYKSTDGGATWNKIHKGLPDADMGRIGMSISPVNPDVLYCIVEASDKKGGVFRSVDRGASWEKRSDNATAGNYYQEIFCDPKNVDKVFYMDFWVNVSIDGGKSFREIGERSKHVDNHALWIDPKDTRHLLVGCDGGLFETYDHGANWEFKTNLPVTQFYKVAVDNDEPFYNVYGGTQDNNTLGGPSRTISANGIHNMDWYITTGGDGFETVVDTKDPNIIYSESQYGGLVRFDKRSGEVLDIKPIEGENEPAYRWNWDAPIIISHFDNKRLYFGANKLFRTDDRGDSWKVISNDLSRGIDRNKLEVMGRVWSMDAVAKNQSTDIYGQLVSIAESWFDENHLVVGTDDGLIHVTTDGGKNWTKVDAFPGVPDRTYVNQIIASRHDKNVFYATFNHHRYADFKPYIYKSTDGGRTWFSISNNLPTRGSTYCVAEDHVNPKLLFCGTEFGVYFTVDGGAKWIQLKGGLPTIAVRDMAIQERENDLVLATFGRGFYILDDYTPLRNFTATTLDETAKIFPIKDALLYVEAQDHGYPLKGFLGESFFTTPNPKVGAVFTYYLRHDIKTIKEKRQAAEKEKIKNNQPVYYPSADSIRLEDNQQEPYVIFTITDANGTVIRKMKAAAKSGLKRIVWDLRASSPGPTNFYTPNPDNPYDGKETGQLVTPGTYNVTLSTFEDGNITHLYGPASFVVKSLNNATLPATDKKEYSEFSAKVAEARRVVGGVSEYRNELANRLKYLRAALMETPKANADYIRQLYSLDERIQKITLRLNGDASLARREFEVPPSVNDRISTIEGGLWVTTSTPTTTWRNSLDIATRQLKTIIADLKMLTGDVEAFENSLENIRAPWTPGRLPEFK